MVDETTKELLAQRQAQQAKRTPNATEVERRFEAERAARNNVHHATLAGKVPQQADLDTINGVDSKDVRDYKTRHIPTAPVKK